MKKKTLLIGGRGNLGSSIIKSGLFKNLYYPKKKKLNILDRNSIRKYLSKNKFNLIINCAAMARIVDCEKNLSKAISINIGGTFNLVKEILSYEKKEAQFSALLLIPSGLGHLVEPDGIEPTTS